MSVAAASDRRRSGRRDRAGSARTGRTERQLDGERSRAEPATRRRRRNGTGTKSRRCGRGPSLPGQQRRGRSVRGSLGRADGRTSSRLVTLINRTAHRPSHRRCATAMGESATRCSSAIPTTPQLAVAGEMYGCRHPECWWRRRAAVGPRDQSGTKFLRLLRVQRAQATPPSDRCPTVRVQRVRGRPRDAALGVRRRWRAPSCACVNEARGSARCRLQTWLS